MAGYVGTKAVLLSTTAANVGGDADIGGALDVGGAFTSQGIDDNATSTAMTLDASGNVGIGVVPQTGGSTWQHVQFGGTGNLVSRISDSTVDAMFASNYYVNASNVDSYITTGAAARMFFNDNTISFDQAASGTAGTAITWSEAMRLDASGNLLVGKTSADNSAGATIKSDGEGYFVKSNGSPLSVNRLSSDGAIQYFFKDTSLVGSIGTHSSNPYMGKGTVGLSWNAGGGWIGPMNPTTLANRDNAIDLGASSVRFNDAFITNGVTTGSDGNDKQDIRDLTEAEQRVAVACKGLLKAWRWKSAVEEKGDDARIHCGIIAQDLQAAFAAEGLDAGRYAMFMSNTWWEHDVEVPAVEAVAEVLDEDGNVVTEAVEAVDAYTRTDTYDTQEEAPEGATERTRLGVRYSELLAFIIGAL